MTIAAKTNWLGLQKSTQDARQYWSREIQSDYLSQQKYIIPKKGADLGSFVHPGKVPQPHLDVGTKFPAHPYGPSWGQTERGFSNLPLPGRWKPEVRPARLFIKLAGKAEARGKSFKAEKLTGGSCPAAVGDRDQQEPVEQRARGQSQILWDLPSPALGDEPW